MDYIEWTKSGKVTISYSCERDMTMQSSCTWQQNVFGISPYFLICVEDNAELHGNMDLDIEV